MSEIRVPVVADHQGFVHISAFSVVHINDLHAEYVRRYGNSQVSEITNNSFFLSLVEESCSCSYRHDVDDDKDL